MGKNGSIVGHIDSSRVVFAQTDCVVSGDFEIVDVAGVGSGAQGGRNRGEGVRRRRS
jgi:hypothetical protein